MNNTKIEWCDSTWNPVTGCKHDCNYCYAKRIANRFGGYEPKYGAGLTQDENGNYDLAENEIKYRLDRKRKKQVAPYPFGFEPTFHRYKLNDPQKWKKPRNIFVCSMADLFGDWVPDEWIIEVFKACEKATQHNYLFLTKNPKRYSELALAGKLPKKNSMWYGSTVTAMEEYFSSQKTFNTFLSIEPMLTSISPLTLNGVQWIIMGAETGNRKNKVIPQKEWISEIVSDCAERNIPIFMKDSLIPIVGEENMRREFPEKLRERE